MEELKCKECGKIFKYEKMSSCKAQLKRHLLEEHNMSVLDYIVKHEYDGKRPMCPCGCGHYLNLAGSGDRWKFTKYYADTCYGNLVRCGNEKIMKQYRESHSNKFDIEEYYSVRYDKETFQKAYDMLKTRNFSLDEVSKSFKYDKRTLKKVWFAFKITTTEELTEILDYTKYHLSSKNYPTNISNNENMMAWMYNLIKAHPGKYTMHSLIKEYNLRNSDNPCTSGDGVVLKALYKTYGDEIDVLLSVGYHSSEEYKFFEVLKFFFPKYICKMGKRFVLNDSYIYFDIIIGSKLLIEYDSEGFFHKDYNKKHDLDKENFAKENGYYFLRLKKEEATDISILTKIKNILENEAC